MIRVEATDMISALDLAERLRRYAARSSALEGDTHEVLVEHVANGDLPDVLGAISDWATAYGFDSVTLRVGAATYGLRLDRPSTLAWREIT
ncbi:MAG TPA: hypothetical protein VFJ91_01010 [Gaiellaceae bacterium]|nr:hypothetical protein [Gaiellaceae bacterium]